MDSRIKVCEINCPQCGSGDIHRSFKVKDQKENLYYKSWPIYWECNFDDEFFTRKWEDFVYKIDCIRHQCRCCGYMWHTPTDAKMFYKQLLAHMNEKEEERRIKYRPLNGIEKE